VADSMEAEPPINLWLFDKSYARKGLVPAPESVEFLSVWNGNGMVAFTVHADNPRMAHLAAPGARVVMTLRRPGMTVPQVVVSGPVMEREGQGLGYPALRVFTVADDWGIFDEIVGWPVPAAAITAQTTSEYHTVTGPAGNVVRSLVLANAPRQGVAVTVPAATGLGATITVKTRMHPLSDQLFPKVSDLNVGVRVFQDPAEAVRRLVIWQPTAHTRALTEESGIIAPGAELRTQAPAKTRVVVGAGGEGTARAYREFIDTAAEAKWGVSRAGVVDARDIEVADPNFTTLVQERADEYLAENAETASLKVQLTETDNWQYGVTFQLGDTVPITLAGEDTVTERVREVQGSWQKGTGLEIEPRIGSWDESPDDKLYRLVARALKVGRNLEVQR
jgi:hypothetical protein